MEKLKMHSPNLTDDNIAKICDLFPGCVTEAKDENGKMRYAVDFDQLRQELSDHIVEGPQERYHLNWPGKREALLTANAPIAKTLRPARDESVNFDTTKNLFIEGDNLEALKLLQETYLGKVKMIYADPPYNTGNDFIYIDQFAESSLEYLVKSNQVDQNGNKLVANTSSNGRFHSDWLSMLYPRLKLARNLISENGVIFISVDDNEIDNLRKICDEIFGEANFVGVFVVKSTPNARDYGHIGKMHEYCLFYAKNILETDTNLIPDEDKSFRYSDKEGGFNIHPLYNSNVAFNSQNRPNLYYPFYVLPEADASGFFSISLQPKKGWVEVFPPLSVKDQVQFVWRWGKEKSSENLNTEIIGHKTEDGEFRIVQKMRHSSKLIRSLFLGKEYSSRRGTAEVEELFGKKLFSFPKPLRLIEDLVFAATSEGEIILDMFAGASTTAHAVLSRNAVDGANRSFVMIQANEKIDEDENAFKAGYRTIADLSKERIRLASQKILEGECHSDWKCDVGFRVLKIDTSNMSDVYYTPGELKQDDLLGAVDNIKPGRDNPEDLLFQVLVDWGVDLTLPIRKETIQGKTVFFVNEEPYDLIACFDKGVTEELVTELAKHKPLRVVFRDNGFKSDAVKINVDQIFRQLSPVTDVKSI